MNMTARDIAVDQFKYGVDVLLETNRFLLFDICYTKLQMRSHLAFQVL